jgi:hypothetical protein
VIFGSSTVVPGARFKLTAGHASDCSGLPGGASWAREARLYPRPQACRHQILSWPCRRAEPDRGRKDQGHAIRDPALDRQRTGPQTGSYL